jgi:hypothetical protein
MILIPKKIEKLKITHYMSRRRRRDDLKKNKYEKSNLPWKFI